MDKASLGLRPSSKHIPPTQHTLSYLTHPPSRPHAHSRTQGNAKALASVSAIIDGVGSIGAAIGPLMTGFLSGQGAFTMLYLSALAAGLLLTPLVRKEVVAFMRRRAP